MFRCHFSNLWPCVSLLHSWQLSISVRPAVKLSISGPQTEDGGERGSTAACSASTNYKQTKVLSCLEMIDPFYLPKLQRLERQSLIMTVSPAFSFLLFSLSRFHRHDGGNLEITSEESISSGVKADLNRTTLSSRSDSFIRPLLILDCAPAGLK